MKWGKIIWEEEDLPEKNRPTSKKSLQTPSPIFLGSVLPQYVVLFVCACVCTCVRVYVCVCVISQFFSYSPTTAIRDIVVQGDDLDGLEEVEIL